MREIINSSLVKVQHMEGTAVYQPKDGGTRKTSLEHTYKKCQINQNNISTLYVMYVMIHMG